MPVHGLTNYHYVVALKLLNPCCYGNKYRKKSVHKDNNNNNSINKNPINNSTCIRDTRTLQKQLGTLWHKEMKKIYIYN